MPSRDELSTKIEDKVGYTKKEWFWGIYYIFTPLLLFHGSVGHGWEVVEKDISTQGNSSVLYATH
ncbi:MAG: hypothetical protein SVY15_07540 [Halobacteriota archaeon]|nr:hypothetical protein [Halobacteriota archaeon]